MAEPGTDLDLYDLPASLVEELLDHAAESGHRVVTELVRLNAKKADYQRELERANLLGRYDDIWNGNHPTSCGIDGSYTVERLLSVDFAAGVAVAIEGLASHERRHWPKPHHQIHIATEKHNEATPTIVRAIMLGYELLQATQAPHGVVMLDQTLTLPIIYFNQAINSAVQAPDLTSTQVLLGQLESFLGAYRDILKAQRTDKQYVGLPKYSSRREVAERLNWRELHEDRGILSYLLETGYYIKPLQLEQPPQAWHFSLNHAKNVISPGVPALAKEIEHLLRTLHVSYFRPAKFIPALRLELPRTVAGDDSRLGLVLDAIREQCIVPAMLEPYPLYLADRMAKAIPRAFPAFRQIAAREVAEAHDGPISQVFFAMNGYRSESGR